MGSILGYLSSLFGSVGATVNTAVPVGVGNRTAITAIVGLVAQAVPMLLPLIPPPYGAAVATLLPVVNQLVTVLLPLFAIAHVAPAVAPKA
jgi:hypothetical protein